ncbi:MAG: undecaprenyldiphospho-muramoylpentapeptide beta-N-acetylglucosaminyltransferase, partial [Anaerolineae bacterium]
MRLMISGGGTGGHVYPALAVVQELRRQATGQRSPDEEGLELLWVGSADGMEQELAARAGIPLATIPAAGLRGKNPVAAGRGLWALGRGYGHSLRLVRRFQPDALFVTGGYVCTPVTLAARRARVPVLIYLPDIEPGLAIKFLSRFADRVAVTAPEAQRFFRPGLTVVSGYPVRPELYQTQRGEARARLGLEPAEPVLLVFGGSRGARSINRAVGAAIEELLEAAQVVHISGHLDAGWMQARRSELGAAQQARYHLYRYLHAEMSDALAAADLVVSRAGASVLGEYPALGLPAILVPYPHAGAHQARNAAYLAGRGAAVVVNDADLATNLKGATLSLLADRARRAQMAAAARALARPRAA